MSQGSIAVVDEQNRFLRWTDKAEIHGDRLPHRTVHIFVFDSQGRMVIQQRHRDKLTYAHYWDMACCGHVERPDYPAGPDDNLDDVYDDVARRELQEELGIETELELLGHFGPTAGVHYEEMHLYMGTHDGPFTIQVEEVEEVARVTSAQYDEMVEDPDIKLTDALMFFVQWLRREKGLFRG